MADNDRSKNNRGGNRGRDNQESRPQGKRIGVRVSQFEDQTVLDMVLHLVLIQLHGENWKDARLIAMEEQSNFAPNPGTARIYQYQRTNGGFVSLEFAESVGVGDRPGTRALAGTVKSSLNGTLNSSNNAYYAVKGILHSALQPQAKLDAMIATIRCIYENASPSASSPTAAPANDKW